MEDLGRLPEYESFINYFAAAGGLAGCIRSCGSIQCSILFGPLGYRCLGLMWTFPGAELHGNPSEQSWCGSHEVDNSRHNAPLQTISYFTEEPKDGNEDSYVRWEVFRPKMKSHGLTMGPGLLKSLHRNFNHGLHLPVEPLPTRSQRRSSPYFLRKFPWTL
ncbi:hypothetical protein DFH07DRAFT_320944 [Mycena maculata]|uniref:Uncharacterized protein n=1 Tax=Mycena maculata TaxID=230809 RepID=A0AAD7KBB0_9AGAR|nr:hypothetical protein DFH07DRAFT_320944 [Mycena maculata]